MRRSFDLPAPPLCSPASKAQLAALDANIKAAGDTTYDVRYRSSTLGAETVKAALQNGSTEAHEMRAFSGEMSEEQRQSLDGVRELMGAVSERSGEALGGFVVAETSPEGGAYFDPNTRVVVIGADALQNGTAGEAVARVLEKDGALGTVVHEVTHGIEETVAGKALAKLVTDDTALHDLAIADVLERGYMKEFFGENANVQTVSDGIERLINKESAGEVLKNPQFAAAFESDGMLKADFAAQLDASIKAAGDTSHGFNRQYYSATARGREAEISASLEREGTKIYDGTLTEAETENLNRLRKAHSALSRMGLVGTDFVISEVSPKFNAYLDGKTVVIGKDMLTNGTYIQKLVHEVEHFTEGTKEWAELASFVFDNSPEVNAAIDTVMNSGYGITQQDVDTLGEGLNNGTLTKGQRTLISEVVALRSEALFGNEQMIAKLTRENRTLAGKILDRIKQFLQVFTAKTPEEKAEVKRLQKAERLFERALGKAGTKYAVEALTRENAENMQVSGDVVLDGAGEVQYNKKELYTSTSAFMREVAPADRHTFARSLANKTNGLAEGEVKTVEIYCGSNIYWFKATGYMQGEMRRVVDANDVDAFRRARKEFRNGIDANTEIADLWSDFVPTDGAGAGSNLSNFENRSGTGDVDRVSQEKRAGNRAGNQGRSDADYRIDYAEIDRIIKGLREQLAATDAAPQKQYSRKKNDEAITLSKGELAKLHANYAGEKVFARQNVVAAVRFAQTMRTMI